MPSATAEGISAFTGDVIGGGVTLQRAAGRRACFRTVTAWDPCGIRHDVEALDAEGFHIVVMTFEGELTAVRMRQVHRHPDEPWWGARRLPQPRPASAASVPWNSSLDEGEYRAAVETVHRWIAAGEVYQANICRVLAASMPGLSMDALFAGVLSDNPAPYAARIDVADAGLDIVSASPELYLRRDGERLRSTPIKGTAVSAEALLAKDATENIMITDLVRNDLQRVCRPGTVAVDGLLDVEHHPGLVHLVSSVVGRLEPWAAWPEILDATFPPGSVSGAPKAAALQLISGVESTARGPYCGAVGWVDADRGEAELAVGIRTFWRGASGQRAGTVQPSDTVSFGAGAGITWDSDPRAEWHETELKARRLLAIAAGGPPSGKSS